MRKLTPALAVAASLLVSRVAVANEGTTGYSGKPYNGVNDTCKTLCHVSGGAVPTVDITVPAAMKAGDTAEVTIVITGTRTRTSMNAALSDGVKATKGQNTEIPFPVETPGEVAAASPPPNGAKGTYTFSFVAPQKNGPIMLWVAAMSANGSGTGGDGVTTTTRTITISGATTPVPEKDAGSDGDGGGLPLPGDGGTKTDSGSGSADDARRANDEDEDSATARRRSTADDTSGCNTSPRSSSCGGALVLLVVAGLVAARRRRP